MFLLYSVLFLAVLSNSHAAKIVHPCGPNEVYNDCSSMCEPNCRDPEPRPCILICGPGKCQCKPGFFRDSTIGKCVRKCPPVDPNQDPCAVVRCSSGPCVVVNGSAVCTNLSSPTTPDDTENPCAFTLCLTGSQCVVKNGQAVCTTPSNPNPADSCALTECRTGTQCVARQVQCFRAPCPPIVFCEPI